MTAPAATAAVDIRTDDGLRAALSRLPDTPGESHDARLWSLFGDHLLATAQRDARRSWRDREEYLGAYVLAGIETMTSRRDRLLRTATPWALLVTICRHAAAGAAAAAVGGGLTGRDPVAHRTRASTRPTVVSLDMLRDAGEFDLACSPLDTR